MFQDYLFYGADSKYRYAYRMTHLSKIVSDACAVHQLKGQRAILLGEILTCGILLSSLLEDEEVINLRVQVGNSISVVSETTMHAQTRGYFECVEGSLEVIQFDENRLLPTSMTVRTLRSQKGSGKLYEGVTSGFYADIEEAVNDHLRQSFQLPSFLRQSVWTEKKTDELRAFGAVFLELPNIPADVSQELRAHVWNLTSMAAIFSESEDPDFLASKLIPDVTAPVKNISPTWYCPCSQESVESMVSRLPQTDLSEMEYDGKPIEIVCHFCGKKYEVSVEKISTFITQPLI